MSDSKSKSFSHALKDFFGFQPGQTLVGFRDELKALTDKDKMELHAGLAAVGVDCELPHLSSVSAAASDATAPAAVAA